MGLIFKFLIYHTFFVRLTLGRSVYDNLNASAALGINNSETLDKLCTTNIDYSVEDFTDYTQDQEEKQKFAPDVPKSRQPRSIKRVLSWVGRGFNKVFNSPYIYNFYPIINYSVGKIMQHLPFLSNNPSTPAEPSPDYPQTTTPTTLSPEELKKQKQMQQEYEEEMEKKQRELEKKQEEAAVRAAEEKRRAIEERKAINDRAKKLAAKYVELYFAKHTQTTTLKTMSPAASALGMIDPNYGLPVQPSVDNNPPVYDQAYAQPNYGAAYPAVEPAVIPPVDSVAPPVQPAAYNPPVNVYNPAVNAYNGVNYVNT